MGDDIDAVGDEVRKAVTRLYSRFRSERAENEVPDAALLVLLALDKRGRMSLTELAESAKVTLGSISQTVRRLEQLDYVGKVRDTEDRRRMLFSLTQAGRAAVAASRRHRRTWLNARLAQFTPAERADISRAAVLLLRLADS